MLKFIRVFIKVVELGSFSKAAAVLNMAPSSVTRAIDSLESMLKVELFKRSTRQLLLTDKGQTFLEGASHLLEQSDVLVNSVAGEQQPEGCLRISVFESFGRLSVCPVIPEFLKKHPKINIEIELENRVVDLAGENVDVGIRIGVPKDSSLIYRKIIPNHTFVCASPDYLANHAAIVAPDNLASHQCLLLNQGRQRSYWYFKKDCRSVKVVVNGNLKSKGGTPLLEAALSGMGVVQLSNWMVSDYVKSGQLQLCLSDWQPLLNEHSSGDVYAVYKQGVYKNPNVKLFLDFLIESTRDKLLQGTW